MLRKIVSLSMAFVLATVTVNFAGVNHISSGTVYPKSQNYNPKGEPTAPVANNNAQVPTTNTQAPTSTQAPQLTAEQLYELQKAQALKAMQASAVANGANAAQNAQMQVLANAMLDIPSGFTADGFAYGLARLAHNLSQKRGEVNFVSATKIKDKQYYVVCQSRDHYANGTFLVDIYPVNEAELKSGYQLWFTLYDINAKKLGTAQVKKMHN